MASHPSADLRLRVGGADVVLEAVVAVVVVEFDVMWRRIENEKPAIRAVVATGLTVCAVAQPPFPAVQRLPVMVLR